MRVIVQLNPVEQTMLDALLAVKDHFTHTQLNRREFRDLMGFVMRAITLGENKAFGCATGKHRGACQCQP
jgi:hypothetical protein